MGFQKRSFRLGILSALLVMMTAVPGAWDIQVPGTALGPSYSWAGGTPDESLQPPPTPTTKRSAAITRISKDVTRPGAATTIRTIGAPLTVRERLIAIWTLVRAMSLRN